MKGKRGRNRILSPEQLAEARHLYETTPTSFEKLGVQFGLSGNTLFDWARKQGWERYKPPAPTPTELEHAAQHVHDSALAAGLAEITRPKQKRKAKSRRKPAKRVRNIEPRAVVLARKRAERAAAEAQKNLAPPDQEGAPVSPAQEGEDPRPDSSRKTGATAAIIQFPGAKPPPEKDTPLRFPVQSKEDRAELKMQMAALRGVLTVQQIAQLERHEEILSSYTHLLHVYLSTHEFVDLEGLSEEEAEEKLHRIQRAAMSRLLPTERDTLSGAIKTLTHSLIQVVQTKRLVAGIAKQGRLPTGRRRDLVGDDDDEESTSERRGEATALDLETLRTVRDAMQVLTGHREDRREPPKPPEPEPLDDLVVERPPEE